MRKLCSLKVLSLNSVLAIILLTCTTTLALDSWEGKVVGVSDGDSITVLNDGRGEKIRLYGIDTPEMGQDFGKKAKSFTSDQVYGKVVTVVPMDHDRYGRTVAVVYPAQGKASLNESILTAGYAWLYSQYCKAPYCTNWSKLEQSAKQKNMGLWNDRNPIAPWDYRTGKTNANGSPSYGNRSVASGCSYHGNIQSHIFHRNGCRYYNCKNCVAVFNSREEAINSGYRPCKVCKP